NLDNLKLILEEVNINLILRILIDISKDFVARSIKTKATQLESISDDENYHLGTILQWELDRLVLFFNSQTPNAITFLYHDRMEIHEDVKNLLIGDRI